VKREENTLPCKHAPANMHSTIGNKSTLLRSVHVLRCVFALVRVFFVPSALCIFGGAFCVCLEVRVYYGVATISRLLKILGLFCKRAL